MRTSSAVFAVLFVFACSDPSTPDPLMSTNQNGGNTIVGPGSNGMTVPFVPPTTAFTYHADIKPIIEGRCASCHIEGGIGPFPLQDYDDVLPVGDLLADVVEHRTMPPFLPSPGCREYIADPSLSVDQIEMVGDWVAGGAPEGDPALAPEPDRPMTPPPPVLDTTLEMPEAYTPRLSPDDYRCFVLDWPAAETRFITGFGIEPGDARVVHHVIAYYASPEFAAQAEALDAAGEGVGYTCFGGPLLDTGDNLMAGQAPWLGAWVPGGGGTKYPAGTGLRVEPGSKVIVQVHYNTLTTDPVPDKTKVQFETAATVEKEAFFRLWANPGWLDGIGMDIPAGDSAVTHRFSLDPTLTTGGRSMTLHSAQVHMHLLGSQASSYVIRANGETDCLMQVNNYDFSWQGGAGFVEPVTIRSGDKLAIECTWDNSMANQPMVDGRQLAPEDRSWGDGSTDEMCLGIYYATVD